VFAAQSHADASADGAARVATTTGATRTAVVGRGVLVGGMAVAVAAGIAVGSGVLVGISVAVGSGVADGRSVAVGLTVLVGLTVAVGRGVAVGAGVYVGSTPADRKPPSIITSVSGPQQHNSSAMSTIGIPILRAPNGIVIFRPRVRLIIPPPPR
jgi:hypothetical protein